MMEFSRIGQARIAVLTVALLIPDSLAAQGDLTLANPHWNITLTDSGYSDFLLDNTPSFEGREYLSGEWGAAIGYRVSGGAEVAAQWLETHWIYPDWTTNSTFTVLSPITQTGVNLDNLPIAESVIANAHVEVTQRFEMLDTVVGTPMGTAPASGEAADTILLSDRYVLLHSYTIRNVSGVEISDLELFQLLHGLNSQRGVYDDHFYSGLLGEFHHDTTLAGVDAFATSSGLEDLIAFHSAVAPTAYEIGYYGIEGNGVDDHAVGKPSDGLHRSIEDNWQTAPFSVRQGTDSFSPPTRWVAGAQRWSLGNLAPGQSVSFDVVLSILTGTTVSSGPEVTGSCDGGSSVPGGIDYEFEEVEVEGTCFSDFGRADESELEVHVAEGEFDALTFQTPGQPVQIWEVAFTGSYAGHVAIDFGYDASLLPHDFDENELAIYHFNNGIWVKLASSVDPLRHSINLSTSTLGWFALGADALTVYTVDAVSEPTGSGVITGAADYVHGAGVTLTATAQSGYVFVNWTEDGVVASASPAYTFPAQSDRTLVANFAPAGSGRIIVTSSTPSAGGTTSGGGEYAPGSLATVSAVPSPGYKFSKWLENDVNVSSASAYQFMVSTDRTLVAKFKPVYSVTVVADPVQGGEPEADPFYELGELAKLKAKPEDGWSLVNWTQNGVVVSTDENFSFNVTGNRDLMAHYALGHRIDLVADPKTAGDVSGGGVYGAGSLATVTAEARSGYLFRDWAESGARVSTDASYAFTSSGPRSLVARFVALPPLVSSSPSPDTILFSWPAGATGWILEESANMNPDSWQTTTRSIQNVDGQNQVLITPVPERIFFRLTYP